MAPLLQPTSAALRPLSPSDRHLFCKHGAGPSVRPSHPTVLAAFHAAASAHPHLPAVVPVRADGALHHAAALTYAVLDRRANQLARALQRAGVIPGDAVAVFLRRGPQMLVAILAALKAGACYVPQHVGLAPPAQLLHVAAAARAAVVLTTDEHAPELPRFPPSVAVLSVDAVARSNVPAEPPLLARPVLPSDRCYIIFTSGTTGTPKGVQVTHANVANVLLTNPMHLGMRPGLNVAQILSIAFDMGAWEMLGCLSHGATLLVRHRSIPNAVKHAHILIATPTVLATLDPADIPHLRTVAVAGEPCPRALALTWSRFATFYNSCGPTETTIVNTAKRVTPSLDVLTIGKPTPNNTVYVLDSETLQPCKIGDVGEMWAGGDCVSAGYLNNPEITAERYRPDPYIGGVGAFMYKTGDLGRWDKNGELEHFGRVDDQVKVRGFRVELDGVSATAERAAGVQKAVVLLVGTELVAYVTPASADEAAVKEAVASKLPYYCVPARVYTLHQLPKTGNGKVDKRQLRTVTASDDGDDDDDKLAAVAVAAAAAEEAVGSVPRALLRRRDMKTAGVSFVRRVCIAMLSWV